MTVSSSQQLNVFFICIAFGLLSGAVFDLGRSIRKVYGGKNVLTIAEDVLFSLLYITALIILCYLFDEGRIRYYHLLGAVFGVLLYALLLSQIVLKVFCAIHMFFIKNILSPLIKLIKLIFIPFKLLTTKIITLFKKLKRKFKRISKNIKNKKKRMKML